MDTWILKYKVEENEQKKTMNGGRDSEWKKKRTVKGWGENCWQMKLEKTLNT